MVEESAAAGRSLSEARQRVDDILLDPEALARREDKEAMARLMAAGGFIKVPT